MLSVSVGVPVTTTGSLNVIVTWMTWPALYEPLAFVELTFVTVGAVTSVAHPMDAATTGVATEKMLFELVIAGTAVADVTSASQAVLLIAAVAPVLASCAHGAIPRAPV